MKKKRFAHLEFCYIDQPDDHNHSRSIYKGVFMKVFQKKIKKLPYISMYMYPRKHEVYEMFFLMTLNKNHHTILMFQFGWKSK